ncbi:deoxyribodipyrimidine photo-lyase [Tanacetum coccineum]
MFMLRKTMIIMQNLPILSDIPGYKKNADVFLTLIGNSNVEYIQSTCKIPITDGPKDHPLNSSSWQSSYSQVPLTWDLVSKGSARFLNYRSFSDAIMPGGCPSERLVFSNLVRRDIGIEMFDVQQNWSSQAVNKSPTHYPCDSARTFRVILFSIHNDEWKSFQCHHQTALRIHKDGDGDASFQLKSDSLPHAHAQTTKTFYKHQDSRIMKAQELKTKTSAQTLIYKIFLQRYQVYQGRLLASFQDDAKYEHVGQDTRSQDRHRETVKVFLDIKENIDFTLQVICVLCSRNQYLVAFVKARKGFIRQAMETDSPVVPVLAFGQSYAYKWWKPRGEFILKLFRATKFTPMVYWGTYCLLAKLFHIPNGSHRTRHSSRHPPTASAKQPPIITKTTTSVQPTRIRVLKEGTQKVGGPVVYWMFRDQRVRDNWALIHAVDEAKKRDVPVAVAFNLSGQFLGAKARQLRFMIRGLKELSYEIEHTLHIPFFFFQNASLRAEVGRLRSDNEQPLA